MNMVYILNQFSSPYYANEGGKIYVEKSQAIARSRDSVLIATLLKLISGAPYQLNETET